MEEPNKWKVPGWMQPGTRAIIAYGRKYPKGVEGTVMSTHKTGHGAQAEFKPDNIPLASCGTGDTFQELYWTVPVLNLEPL